MKIAHEAPLSILNKVQEVTDYDYALVHLFEENEKYYNFFRRALEKGREVILDNSVFELGTAFNNDEYYKWITLLRPTYYIIPDVLEDAEKTVNNIKTWQHIPERKTIGVVQGKSIEEIVWCYQVIEPLVDKVAISFDYSFFIDEDLNGKLPTKYHHYMYGRDALLNYMLNIAQVINVNKPHHLLGCGLPQEFESYRDYKWVDSLDTSNPVVTGLKGIRYNGTKGLEDKPSEKLFTLVNSDLNEDQLGKIFYNIECFRAIVNG
jgi:hypothetical protein